MMRLVALLGLAAGGIVALGKLSAAQWHAVGAALLALTLAYGLTILPWLLTALFAWLWVRQKGITQIWYDGWREENAERMRQAAKPPVRRRRATR